MNFCIEVLIVDGLEETSWQNSGSLDAVGVVLLILGRYSVYSNVVENVRRTPRVASNAVVIEFLPLTYYPNFDWRVQPLVKLCELAKCAAASHVDF
jgi:hypothetical protein